MSEEEVRRIRKMFLDAFDDAVKGFVPKDLYPSKILPWSDEYVPR